MDGYGIRAAVRRVLSVMELDKAPDRRPAGQRAPARFEPGEGCLTTAVRIPVRVVVLVLVVPVRMVWDLLAVGARALHRSVLRPVGRGLSWLGRTLIVIPLVWLYESLLAPLARALGTALMWLAKALFVWPWVALWRYVLVPVVTYGVVVPVVWLYETLLTPAGHALALLGAALARYLLMPVVRYGIVVPVVWLYEKVLTPVGHGTVLLVTGVGRGIAFVCVGLWTGLVWLVLTLLVTPLSWIYRTVLAPVGREIGAAFGVAWRIAGYLSRAVGRVVTWLALVLIGRPAGWFYREVCTPVGHVVRDSVWAPARKAAAEAGRAAGNALRYAGDVVRQTRRDAWRALVGSPRSPVSPHSPRHVAPPDGRTRTLEETTTVPGAVPAPVISLRKQM